MSLVERALKKLQQSTPRPGQAPAAPADIVADAVAATTAPAAQAPQAPIRRRVPQRAPISVDRNALRAAGLMAPEHQDRQLGDQYRQIKRPLIANARGRGTKKVHNGQLIMTASALPGEGKTFTSLNLALSMALEKDLNVLLVDADVAKRHISGMLGLADEPGLLDALKDDSLDLESLVIPTDIENLSILPAGNRTDIATELLSSTHMENTVTRLAAEDPNRIVLLDSPPLLLTSEGRALAAMVGQVVVVVRAGHTPQQAVFDAVSYIPADKAVGFVLNQSQHHTSEGYYYSDAQVGAAQG